MSAPETGAIAGPLFRHPYKAVLLAAGLGYVLGGGLFTRLTFNVLRVGFRVGALPLVRRELFNVAEAALSARSGAPSRSPDGQTHTDNGYNT